MRLMNPQRRIAYLERVRLIGVQSRLDGASRANLRLHLEIEERDPWTPRPFFAEIRQAVCRGRGIS